MKISIKCMHLAKLWTSLLRQAGLDVSEYSHCPAVGKNHSTHSLFMKESLAFGAIYWTSVSKTPLVTQYTVESQVFSNMVTWLPGVVAYCCRSETITLHKDSPGKRPENPKLKCLWTTHHSHIIRQKIFYSNQSKLKRDAETERVRWMFSTPSGLNTAPFQ